MALAASSPEDHWLHTFVRRHDLPVDTADSREKEIAKLESQITASEAKVKLIFEQVFIRASFPQAQYAKWKTELETQKLVISDLCKSAHTNFLSLAVVKESLRMPSLVKRLVLCAAKALTLQQRCQSLHAVVSVQSFPQAVTWLKERFDDCDEICQKPKDPLRFFKIDGLRRVIPSEGMRFFKPQPEQKAPTAATEKQTETQGAQNAHERIYEEAKKLFDAIEARLSRPTGAQDAPPEQKAPTASSESSPTAAPSPSAEKKGSRFGSYLPSMSISMFTGTYPAAAADAQKPEVEIIDSKVNAKEKELVETITAIFGESAPNYSVVELRAAHQQLQTELGAAVDRLFALPFDKKVPPIADKVSLVREKLYDQKPLLDIVSSFSDENYKSTLSALKSFYKCLTASDTSPDSWYLFAKTVHALPRSTPLDKELKDAEGIKKDLIELMHEWVSNHADAVLAFEDNKRAFECLITKRGDSASLTSIGGGYHFMRLLLTQFIIRLLRSPKEEIHCYSRIELLRYVVEEHFKVQITTEGTLGELLRSYSEKYPRLPKECLKEAVELFDSIDKAKMKKGKSLCLLEGILAFSRVFCPLERASDAHRVSPAGTSKERKATNR